MNQIALPLAIGAVLMLLATLAPLRAHSASRAVLAFVPPWQQGGIARAASFGLPIMDLPGDHVIVLDLRGQIGAVARLRAAGLWLFDASAIRICAGLMADPVGAKPAQVTP